MAVRNIFSDSGKSPQFCQRMNYAPETTPQNEEAVRKDDTTRMLVRTNWLFFGIRHP
jgi:hypothetical protein